MNAPNQIGDTVICRGTVEDAAEIAESAARTFEETFSGDVNQ